MKNIIFNLVVWAIPIAALVLSACSSATVQNQPSSTNGYTAQTELIASTDTPTDSPVSTSVPSATPSSTEGPGNDQNHQDCDPPFEDVNLQYFNLFWPETNFCKINVDPNEIFIGIVSKDSIPAIDTPIFISIDKANEWLGDDWPIMRFENEGVVRGYPLAILIWHEIVNDTVGGKPVALTFCPLCNATIVFNRTLPDGTVLDFGTTGNLRNSDLVMYDRQTESWWQQFTGEAIVGDLTGTMLDFLPSQIISWSEFKTAHPDAEVLSRDTGHQRSYGENPYPGYDDVNSSPWFPGLDDDDRLPAMERVAAVVIDGKAKAYPFSSLEINQVANDTVNGAPIVLFWKSGTRTTFGKFPTDVGSSGVFSRKLEDQVLTFTPADNGYEDLETGTLWNILGQAVSGPLFGSSLTPIVSDEHFWFAWSVFLPDTEVWMPEG